MALPVMQSLVQATLKINNVFDSTHHWLNEHDLELAFMESYAAF